MKVATLHQPWASLCAMNWKGVETRDKYVSYRGPMAIHSAKLFPECGRRFLNDTLLPAFPELVGFEWPLGVILCKVEVIDCVETFAVGLKASAIDYRPPLGWMKELQFGNYESGRWAILMKFIKRVEPPIPARGMPSFLWEFAERKSQ